VPASLPEDARKRLAVALRERVLPRFARAVDGASSDDARAQKAQSAAAAKLGVSASTINRLVNHEQGGSYELIRRVARYLNEDPAAFFEGAKGDSHGSALRELHGYEQALHEAKKRIEEEGRDISPEALLAAGDFRISPPLKRVTAQFLIAVAVEYSRAPEEPPVKGRGRKK
jgi:transcriptional regulator with XRE-family HTH domain